MKLRKACDIYSLTTEHLRHAGPASKIIILRLLKNIIGSVNYLTCPQIKKGLSTMTYKGKKKPITESSSHRRITVTPQLGGIIDMYIDNMAEYIFREVQTSLDSPVTSLTYWELLRGGNARDTPLTLMDRLPSHLWTETSRSGNCLHVERPETFSSTATTHTRTPCPKRSRTGCWAESSGSTRDLARATNKLQAILNPTSTHASQSLSPHSWVSGLVPSA